MNVIHFDLFYELQGPSCSVSRSTDIDETVSVTYFHYHVRTSFTWIQFKSHFT